MDVKLGFHRERSRYKAGTELVSWGVCTHLVSWKVSCFWGRAFDFHFLAVLLPGLVPFLCASQPQIPTLEDLFVTL